MGLQIHVLHATTSREIDAAFKTFGRERLDALFVTGDSFYTIRRAQLVALTAGAGIPAAYSVRDFVVAGRLMSYGAELLGRYRSSRRLYRQHPQRHQAR
jgi:putative ABC transport system substrate-binding protein